MRLSADTIQGLTHEQRTKQRTVFEDWVSAGGSKLTRANTPWASASVTTPDQAEEAYNAAYDLANGSLPKARRHLSEVLGSAVLREPGNVDEWAERLTLLSGAAVAAEHFGDDVLARDVGELEEIEAGLAPAARLGISRAWAQVTDKRYRAAKRVARSALRSGQRARPARLRELLYSARAFAQAWPHISTEPAARPCMVGTGDVSVAVDAFDALKHDLARLGTHLPVDDLWSLLPEALQQAADRLVADRQQLYKLLGIRAFERELEDAGLGELLAAARAKALDAQHAAAVFDQVTADNILRRIEASDPHIASFDGARHVRDVEQFVKLDTVHRDSASQRVRRAAAELAVATSDAYPTENGVIRDQAGRKRGHKPLRRLLSDAPHLLTALRPCWTMSPLLVSEVIPSDLTLFDVVVFDEASQVPPSHAVCSLGRAHQAVVAGDRHQLPPSDWFKSDTLEEDDRDHDEDADEDHVLVLTSADYESLIDVLLPVLPQPQMLTWHYRSRDERLIGFSNAHIYDRALTTFPGVVGEGLIRHLVVPHMARAGGRTNSNPNEVSRVVEEILDHAATRPDESLGVIAMGQDHASNIDDELRIRLAEQGPDVNGFFADSTAEPFFVKNLERVQGDERDAIVLSVGYSGRTADGKLSYRFGPLSNEGGERRLNVAVTRARNRMALVSSFRADDMDPSRSAARGVDLLRRYLEFASHGGDYLRDEGVTGAPLNGFEKDVADRLRAAGLPLHPQYGVGRHRIDFAAAHPDQPGQMVLAIEADGASYHSSVTARDRDRLRQQILESKGWRFHRIWSTEWFRNPEAETKRAVEAWQDAIRSADGPDQHPAGRASAAVERPTVKPAAANPAKGRALAKHRKQDRRPSVAPGLKINEYSHDELVALARWVRSDGRLRTEDELLKELMDELDFKARGKRIVAALTQAIRETA